MERPIGLSIDAKTEYLAIMCRGKLKRQTANLIAAASLIRV